MVDGEGVSRVGLSRLSTCCFERRPDQQRQRRGGVYLDREATMSEERIPRCYGRAERSGGAVKVAAAENCVNASCLAGCIFGRHSELNEYEGFYFSFVA